MKNKVKNIVLITFCIYSLFFVLGSFLAPVMAHIKQYDFSAILTSTYMFSCHQRPERCFWILGYPVALCARCLGFYLGVSLSAFLVFSKEWSISYKIFWILFVISIADILANSIFKINTFNATRFAVGIVMGILFVNLICYGFNLKKGEDNCVN